MYMVCGPNPVFGNMYLFAGPFVRSELGFQILPNVIHPTQGVLHPWKGIALRCRTAIPFPGNGLLHFLCCDYDVVGHHGRIRRGWSDDRGHAKPRAFPSVCYPPNDQHGYGDDDQFQEEHDRGEWTAQL